MNRKRFLALLLSVAMLLGMMPAANASEEVTFTYHYDQSDTYASFNVVGTTVAAFPTTDTAWQLPEGKAFLGWVLKAAPDKLYFPGSSTPAGYTTGDFYAVFVNEPYVSMNNADDLYISTSNVMYDLQYGDPMYTGSIPDLQGFKLYYMESADDTAPEELTEVNSEGTAAAYASISETGYYYWELTYAVEDASGTLVTRPFAFYAKPNLTINANFTDTDIYPDEVAYVTVEMTGENGYTLFGEYGDVTFNADGKGSASVTPDDPMIKITGLPSIYGKLSYKVYIVEDDYALMQVYDPDNVTQAFIEGTVDPVKGVEHTDALNIKKLRSNYSFKLESNGDANDSFNVTFNAHTIHSDNLDGQYGDVTFEDGVATVSVKPDQLIKITGLPARTSVKADIAEKTNYTFSATLNGESIDEPYSGFSTGVINHGQTAAMVLNAAYTETLHSLEIYTYGSDAEEGDKFTYTITLKDRSGNPITSIDTKTYEYYGGPETSAEYTDEDGVYEIAVPLYKYLRIDNLPYNTSYDVVLEGEVPENGGDGTFDCTKPTVGEPEGNLTENVHLSYQPDYTGDMVYLTCREMVETEGWPDSSKFRVGRVIMLPQAINNYSDRQKQIGWRVEGDTEGKIYLLNEPYTVTNEYSTILEPVWEEKLQLGIHLSGMGEFVPEDAEFTVDVQLTNRGTNTPVTGTFYDDDGNAITFDEVGKASFKMRQKHAYGTDKYIYDLPTRTLFTVKMTAPETTAPESYTAITATTVSGEIISSGDNNDGVAMNGRADFYFSYYNEFEVTFEPANGEAATTQKVTTNSPYATTPGADTLTAPDGKVFDGWRAENGGIYADNVAVAVTGATTFTALWIDAADGGYTVTVEPGYIIGENDERIQVQGTTYIFPESEEGDEPLFMGDLFEGKVQVAGEIGSDTARYTYTAPENTGLLQWEYITYRDGVEIAHGICGDSIYVTVQGDLEIYPVYNTKLDITLDYAKDGIDDVVITGHVEDTLLYVDDYRHNAVVNGQVHTGWYIDKNQNGVYESDNDTLLWDFYSDSNYYSHIGAAELEGTVNNNTITALWADGFTIVYRDYDAEGTVLAEQTDFYLSEQYSDGASVWLRDSYPETWTPSGEFAGWTTDGQNSIDYVTYAPGTSEYVVYALWEEAPEYGAFALSITDTNGNSYTGLPVDATNTVTVSKNGAAGYTLTAGVAYGQIPAKDESGAQYSYKWNVMPMENGENIPEYDENGSMLGVLSAVITEDSITGETLLNQFDQQYSQYRLILGLYDPADENNITGGIDNTRYMAYVDVNFTEDTVPTITITIEGAELADGEATVSQDDLGNIVLTAEQIGYANQDGRPAMWYWDIYNADTDELLAQYCWGQQYGDKENTPVTLSLSEYLHHIASASKLKIVARTTDPYQSPETELARADVVINVTEPELGSVVLKIAIDGDSYTGVTDDVLNPSTGYIYARYEASGIESSYNPYWTLVPVDEYGDTLTDEYGDELAAIWTSDEGNWTDYIRSVYDLESMAQEYGYQYVRLTLSMKNAQTGAIYNPDNSKNYMASRVLYFEPAAPELTTSLQVLIDGVDVGFNDAVSKNADAKITVVVENAPDDANYTYGWEIVGQANGYDNGRDYPSEDEAHADFWLNQGDRPESDRNVVSLQDDLLFMDADESEWYIHVYTYNEGNTDEPVSACTGYLKIKLYDYSASITAADADGNAIEDISAVGLTHESDVTFTAALATEYEGEASDYSWVWTAEANGIAHTLAATDADVTLKDIAALDQYASSWTLKAYAQNSDGQLSSEAELSFSYPYAGGFTLFIDASNVDGNYNYTGTTGNTGTFGDSADSGIHLRPAWVGEPEGGMDTYSPVWTASPLDENGQPMVDVSFDLYVDFYGWDYEEDYGDLYSSAIRDADANKEYAENTQWRVTLELVHNEDPSVVDTVDVDMYVPIRYEVELVGQSGDQSYDAESLEATAFPKSQELVLTPSIDPAPGEEISWTWDVRCEYDEWEDEYGIYERIEGETLTLSQLIELYSEVTVWEVRAVAWSGENRIAKSNWLPIDITYDYNAAITVTMNGEPVDDLASQTVYVDSNVSFTAAVAPDYDGEITWNWVAEKKIRTYDDYDYTAYPLDATSDTISLAEVVACDTYAKEWRVRAYATVDGETISTDGIVDDFELSYAGNFHVAIVKQDVWNNIGEDIYFTGVSGNTDHNPHFKSGYHATYYGTPGGFGDSDGKFYPRWTASALDENGNVITKDGQEMTFQILHSVNDEQTGDAMWTGWIYNDEIGNIFGGYGFGLYGDAYNFHPYWRLTLSIDNDGSAWETNTGEEYNPNYEYRASVDITLGMPAYTGIYGNDWLGYVSRDNISAVSMLGENEFLYQVRNNNHNIALGSYDYPLWTAQPIVDGVLVGVAMPIEPSGNAWGIEEDWDYEYDGIDLGRIQNAFAGTDYAGCRSWRITLQLADANGNPLPTANNLNWDTRTVVDVEFYEPEIEEDVYELKLTDTARDRHYYSDYSGPDEEPVIATAFLDPADKTLTLDSEMSLNYSDYEGAYTISWAWVGTGVNGEYIRNPQDEMTTGSSYTFDSLLEQANEEGLAISATAYIGTPGEPDCISVGPVQINVRYGQNPRLEFEGDNNRVGSVGDQISFSATAYNIDETYRIIWEYDTRLPMSLRNSEVAEGAELPDGAVLTETINEDGSVTSTISIDSLQLSHGGSYIVNLCDANGYGWGGALITLIVDEASEPEYTLKLVNVETNEIYEKQADGSEPVILLPKDASDLKLKAELYLGDEIVPEDSIKNCWWSWTVFDGEDMYNSKILATTMKNVEDPYDSQQGPVASFANALAVDGKVMLRLSPNLTTTDDVMHSMFLRVLFTESEPEPEPETSGVKFYVNGAAVANGATVDVAIGDVAVKAEGFGDAATYAITYLVDNVPVSADGSGVLMLNFTEAGQHTIRATASDASGIMLLSMDNGDGIFTGTITLNVSEETAAPEGSGNSVLVDPSDASDPNNTEQIDVTGILKSNETVTEPTIYGVEITWGEMAFQYVSNKTTNSTWDPVEHKWSSSTSESETGWELINKNALALPDGAGNIFSNPDQSYVVVFNHSNAMLNVNMANRVAENNYGVTASLTEVGGGVGATTATTADHAYTLGRGIEGTKYASSSGTAAKIILSGKPAEGISDGEGEEPSTIARLTVTISQAD